MSVPPPQPISHTVEMVIATIVGVAVGLSVDNLLLGCGVGIAVGILLSIIKTLYVDRARSRRRMRPAQSSWGEISNMGDPAGNGV